MRPGRVTVVNLNPATSFQDARSASPESIFTIVVMDSGPALVGYRRPKAHPGMTKAGYST